MQVNLRIAVWNANGITSKINEIDYYMRDKFIDIFLISETHLTARSYVKIKGYDFICTNHPDGKAHAGAGLFIKSTLQYEIAKDFQENYIQSVGVKVICNNIPINIYSIYSPPRHSIKLEEYENFFKNLGVRFIVGGDYNAKHPWWGSRLANPKGKQLYKCLLKNNFCSLSGNEPTYWPSDPTKIPDLLDFIVYNGISRHSLDILNDVGLNSDHTPFIVNYNTNVKLAPGSVKLLRRNSNLNFFSEYIENNLNLNTRIDTTDDLDDTVEYFTTLIHQAALLSTPNKVNYNNVGRKVQASAAVRNMIRESRRLRRVWHRTRNPRDKTIWNLAIKLCSEMLANERNDSINSYLKALKPQNKDKEYELYKATKFLKRPSKRNVPIKSSDGTWCKTDKEKSTAFAAHLEDTFKPHSTNTNDGDIRNFLDVACQMHVPIKHISPLETKKEINLLNNNKSTGYDNIDAFTLKHLPPKAITFLTLIFNSILRLQHFPSQWKCAEIIMVLKPNKSENLLSSYRPISLLSIVSKLFEKLFLKRLTPFLNENNIIPDHQFGFRSKHGTPEQCHRVIQVITKSFEEKNYCSAVFLDIQQAFDKVWHEGLLYKIKTTFPAPFYIFFLSYLKNRCFYVKVNNDISKICQINAGIPQGSVLGPVLYTLFTYDMPTHDDITTATYADDTAFLSSNCLPSQASSILQEQLDSLHLWLTKWNIVINTEKSKHITFALRRETCPPVYLNNKEIPRSEIVKYLGLHLDRRLTWRAHITAKRKQLDMRFKKMYWLLGRKSQLSLNNKVLLLKTILKPIWTYGIELWGTASDSNIEILQRFQSKALRSITNAPYYITNKSLHNDLSMPFIKSEIKRYSSNYLARLSNHTNVLAIALLDETDEIRRLKRNHILDLPFI